MRAARHIVGIAVTVALLGAGPAEECAAFRKTLPKGVFQGFLEVPEVWANPGGPKIKIFYYGRKAAGREIPLVFFNGGPGQASHESFQAFEESPDGRALPMIFFDQRGNGCSSPYPTGNDVKTMTRLLNYGSRAIVLDAEALRKKIYGDKVTWRAFGQSYGGYIVHRYLEVAPGGLAAALAHGAAIYKDDGDFARLRILAQKRSADRYFAKYPQDVANLAKAKAQIGPKTCFQNKTMKVCGPAMLDSIVYVLAFENTWPDLHGLIEQLAVNSKAALPAYINSSVLTEPQGAGLLPTSIIATIEAPAEAAADRGKTSCEVAQGRLKAEGQKPETWAFNECRYFDAITSLATPSVDALTNTTYVPDPFSLEAVAKALKANPGLPFFLYASKNDPIVPIGAFVDEVKALGSLVKLRFLKDSGHDGFLTEPRVWRDLKATATAKKAKKKPMAK